MESPRPPGRKLQPGVTIHFDEHFSAEIIARGERGERTVRFLGDEDVYTAIDRSATCRYPLHQTAGPPRRPRPLPDSLRAHPRLRSRPTAGLHFTGEILDRARNAGAHLAHVTLHVGLGTFQPIDREDFENHQLHYERYSITDGSWQEIESAQRIVAVGTTSVRTLEAAAVTGHHSGSTNLFLYPGCQFQQVGAMLTNFHLPRTSLLLLVAAFAGTELTLAAYRHAVEQRYRSSLTAIAC